MYNSAMHRETSDNLQLWSFVAQPVLGAIFGGPISAAPIAVAAAVSGGTVLSLVPESAAAQSFLALGCLIALDMVLGTAKALWVDRDGFSSTKFGKGAVKSAFVLLVPLSLWVLARVDPLLAAPLHWLSTSALVWFGCWEAASIIKNAGKCGLPIPPAWLELLSGTMAKAGRKAPRFKREESYAPQTTVRRSGGRPEGQAEREAPNQEADGQDSGAGHP